MGDLIRHLREYIETDHKHRKRYSAGHPRPTKIAKIKDWRQQVLARRWTTALTHEQWGWKWYIHPGNRSAVLMLKYSSHATRSLGGAGEKRKHVSTLSFAHKCTNHFLLWREAPKIYHCNHLKVYSQWHWAHSQRYATITTIYFWNILSPRKKTLCILSSLPTFPPSNPGSLLPVSFEFAYAGHFIETKS